MKISILISCVLLMLLLLVCDDAGAKRSSGSRRGKSSSGSSSWWNRRKSSSSGSSSSSQAKPEPKPVAGSYPKQGTAGANAKPSAPVEAPIKKETGKLQQSSPNQPQPPQPGWNTHGYNNPPAGGAGGWKSGYQTHGAPPAYSPAGHYPHGAAPPAYNGQPTWGAPPTYPGHAPSYGGFGHGYPQQSGGYGGYPHQSFGGYNPGYGGMGMGGMGMGAMGMSGMGMGGYGGGFGGYGGGGYYPMKKKSFFSGSTVTNVLAGMFIYSMASKLISYGFGSTKPYTVINYYNQPNQTMEEIKLPTNILVLCEGNASQLCGQGMQSVCTQNGTVLCVATMNQASPCDQGGNAALCVNTTVPCVDANDPLCQNSSNKDRLEADVNVPCFTNLTLDVNLLDKSNTQPNTKYTYCVTTMAIAGPDYQICSDLTNSNDYRSVLGHNYEWFLEIEGFRRNYSIYNYERPMEASGDIHMPLAVLMKCSDNATKVCAPGTIPTCTTFNEIMCLASLVDTSECTDQNNTCVKSEIPCPENIRDDVVCQNKTEGASNVILELPCFANITINAPISKFNLAEYNGTLNDVAVNTSYTYHYNYCVVTLALPGSDLDLCVTKEAKERSKGESNKS